MSNITANDINASIGRKYIAARAHSGEWMLCLRTSGFMAPFAAFVIRPLTAVEVAEAEAALVSESAVSFLPI